MSQPTASRVLQAAPGAPKTGVWGSGRLPASVVGGGGFAPAPSALPAPADAPADFASTLKGIWSSSPAAPLAAAPVVEPPAPVPSVPAPAWTSISFASVLQLSQPASKMPALEAELAQAPTAASAPVRSIRYTREEMLRWHKPSALPEYLPLIEGLTTRHSLSPALLDPFNAEEAASKVAKHRSSKSRSSGLRAPVSTGPSWTKDWSKQPKPATSDSSKGDAEAFGDLESDPQNSWDLLSAQSAQFDRLKHEPAAAAAVEQPSPVATLVEVAAQQAFFGSSSSALLQGKAVSSSSTVGHVDLAVGSILVTPVVSAVTVAPPAPAPVPANIGSLFGPQAGLGASGASPWSAAVTGGMKSFGAIPAPAAAAPPVVEAPRTVAPPPALAAPAIGTCHWSYRDPQGVVQGPFSTREMREWFEAGFFVSTLPIRCDSGPFHPLSTMFPDSSAAFSFVPDIALPAPAAAPEPRGPPPELQLLFDAHQRAAAQIALVDRDLEGLKKAGQELGLVFNHHNALLMQAQQSGRMDEVMKLQAVVQQLYSQLSLMHSDSNAKMRSLAQLRTQLLAIDGEIRQLQQVSVAAPPARPVAVPEPWPKSAAEVHHEKVEFAKQEAKDKADRDRAVVSNAWAAVPITVVAAPAPPAKAAVSFAAMVQPKAAEPAVARAPVVAEPTAKPATVSAPAPDVIPGPSLLELQSQEASRKLGITAPKAAPVVVTPAAVAVAEVAVAHAQPAAPVVASAWASSAAKPVPSKQMAQIQREAAAEAALAAAAAKAEVSAAPAPASVWGVSVSPVKPATVSLRNIQAEEEQSTAAAAAAAPQDDDVPTMKLSQLGDALKHMLGVAGSWGAPAPAPAPGPDVWGQKEVAKVKPTKSLREIQEEEARREAEAALVAAAHVATAASLVRGSASSGGTSGPSGAWARAAAKGVPLPYAPVEPAASIRSIQAQELSAAPATVVQSAAPAGIWSSKVKPSLAKAAPAEAAKPAAAGGSDMFWDFDASKSSAPTAKPAAKAMPAARAAVLSPPPAAAVKPVPASPAKPKPTVAAAPAPTPAPAVPKAAAAAGPANEFGGSSMSPEFASWCTEKILRITGSEDITLAKFCMTVDNSIEVREYIRSYFGSTPEVAAFANEFIRRKTENKATEDWNTPAARKAKKKGGK